MMSACLLVFTVPESVCYWTRAVQQHSAYKWRLWLGFRDYSYSHSLCRRMHSSGTESRTVKTSKHASNYWQLNTALLSKVLTSQRAACTQRARHLTDPNKSEIASHCKHSVQSRHCKLVLLRTFRWKFFVGKKFTLWNFKLLESCFCYKRRLTINCAISSSVMCNASSCLRIFYLIGLIRSCSLETIYWRQHRVQEDGCNYFNSASLLQSSSISINMKQISLQSKYRTRKRCASAGSHGRKCIIQIGWNTITRLLFRFVAQYRTAHNRRQLHWDRQMRAVCVVDPSVAERFVSFCRIWMNFAVEMRELHVYWVERITQPSSLVLAAWQQSRKQRMW